jgi:hypothetical protein
MHYLVRHHCDVELHKVNNLWSPSMHLGTSLDTSIISFFFFFSSENKEDELAVSQ